MAKFKTVEAMIKRAEKHGEEFDEPEAEIGDLQELLRSAWENMTAPQRKKFCEDAVEILNLED